MEETPPILDREVGLLTSHVSMFESAVRGALYAPLSKKKMSSEELPSVGFFYGEQRNVPKIAVVPYDPSSPYETLFSTMYVGNSLTPERFLSIMESVLIKRSDLYSRSLLWNVFRAYTTTLER